MVSLQECKTQLRHCRESQGFTIKDLSDTSKIPRSTLYDIETGRRSLNAQKAKYVADSLGVPIDHLFFPTYYRALPM
ncbi:helix-turn-helix domain-containing protein [Bacillus pseudomycoides]|uniref:helix-turn-helix domain-containing protein n=1 Tax=Bacillus pseudomycoides TaxID=64104 RepID=UPI000BF062F6|nr:helix-turn-helix transcriptional regulator [Bacillus pseudomycoides]PEK70470.1 transcriptional regulator [Bacillus pseudomycoides]PEN08646.1 transcriptional regulator [Bacillus pseudomycoides]PFW93864.1 transcriptional regulator [Bacillus pseudomycoides]PFZ93688.1 transcriptional regulator [Bacillus pseudomycoides]PGA76433.1 transcriptional regulator [Bacillus pseudomycoides]